MATPNEAQTLGLMVDTIRDRILDRIDELNIEKVEISKGKTRGYYKKIKNKDLYDAIGKLEKQVKSLNRGLGGLLTSDPNKVINPKTGETWGQLVNNILHENIQGEALAKRLEKFGSFVYASSNVNPGKVGHHRTGLGILRSLLENKPFDYRVKFKEIAASNGYQIGEEFIDFIDPAAHKEFTSKVGDSLSKRLGYKTRSDVPQNLLDAIADRYAHAKQFGGNKGWDAPVGWLKEGVDEETLFKFAQPYLEASKRGADAGLQMDEILTKGVWETPEDLIKQFDKVALNQTDDLVDIFGNQLGTTLSAKQKAARQVNPDVLAKMGLSEADLNPKVFKAGQIAADIAKHGDKLTKTLGNLTSKTRAADLAAQTATGIATGNVAQAGIAGTTLAMTEALKNPAAQKAIAKQLGSSQTLQKLLAKRAAKTTAKLIPGVDIGISAAESWGYLKQGKLDQASIAALSGAIGWIPVIGDGASAALDLTNTGIDISRLDFNQKADEPEITNVKKKNKSRLPGADDINSRNIVRSVTKAF